MADLTQGLSCIRKSTEGHCQGQIQPLVAPLKGTAAPEDDEQAQVGVERSLLSYGLLCLGWSLGGSKQGSTLWRL